MPSRFKRRDQHGNPIEPPTVKDVVSYTKFTDDELAAAIKVKDTDLMAMLNKIHEMREDNDSSDNSHISDYIKDLQLKIKEEEKTLQDMIRLYDERTAAMHNDKDDGDEESAHNPIIKPAINENEASVNTSNDNADDSEQPLLQSRNSQSRSRGSPKREIAGSTSMQEIVDNDDREVNNCYQCFRRFFRKNTPFNIGYRMVDYVREIDFKLANPEIDLEGDAKGLAVGLNIKSVHSNLLQRMGMVKPVVMIHAVSISTGYYIRSRGLPFAKPVVTKSCFLKDTYSVPYWDEDLVIDAFFSDVANDDTILLFEIIDDKPSLSSSNIKKQHRMKQQEEWNNNNTHPTAKRIAWGYLLPLGLNGELNVGFSDEWKTSMTSRPPSPSKRSSPAKETTLDDSNHEKTTNEDENSSQSTETVEKEERLKALLYSTKKKNVDIALRLQLFQYHKYDGPIGFLQRKTKGWPLYNNYVKIDYSDDSLIFNEVPEVYVQWSKLKHKRLHESMISITIGPRKGEKMSSRALMNQTALIPIDNSNEELSQQLRRYRNKHNVAMHTLKTKTDLNKIRNAVFKRSRGYKEACVPPDKLLNRIDVGHNGAMVVSFSNSGHVLAVASEASPSSVGLNNKGHIYSIRFFDVDFNEEVWIAQTAHHGVIYDLKWSKNDRYLLSCSGDGTCKVWDLISLVYCLHKGPLTKSDHQGSNNSEDGMGYEHNNEDQKWRLEPYLLYSLACSPPVYVYSAIFQEFGAGAVTTYITNSLSVAEATEKWVEIEKSTVPRIITGNADGRIRVWDNNELVGYIAVPLNKEEVKTNTNYLSFKYPAHDGLVNSLVIDERSRYLISGDSVGDILAWRCDTRGWYQLLRKFKKDATSFSQGSAGVLSLSMHPDRNKGQMLVMTRAPSVLKVMNMSTYRSISQCAGFSGVSANISTAANIGGSIFSRASFSADGRFVICGSFSNSHSSQYKLQIWDSQSGHALRMPLSDFTFPYPVRSISWHPKQHLIAVAMVGPQAAVAIYATDKESADKIVEHVDVTNTPTKQLSTDNLDTQPLSTTKLLGATDVIATPLKIDTTSSKLILSNTELSTTSKEKVSDLINRIRSSRSSTPMKS